MLGRSLPEAWVALAEPVAGFECQEEDMVWDFDAAIEEQADFSLEAAALEEEEFEEDFAALLASAEGTSSASSSAVAATAAEGSAPAEAVQPQREQLLEGAKRRRLSTKQPRVVASVPAATGLAAEGPGAAAAAAPEAPATQEETS